MPWVSWEVSLKKGVQMVKLAITKIIWVIINVESGSQMNFYDNWV